MQAINLFGNRHKGAWIDVKGHCWDVSKSKLPTGPSSEAVDLTKIRQDHCVNISARCMDEFVLLQSIDTHRDWLVGVAVFVCRESLCIWMSELATGASSPRIQVTRLKNCYCMCLSTRHFFHRLLFECLNHLGFRLIRTAVLVFGHTLGVWVPQLPAASSSPWEESTLVCQRNSVCITTGNLHNLDTLKEFNQSWSWLIRITFYVGRQIFHRLQTELSASTCAPRVNISISIYSYSMPVTSRNLIYSFVSKLSDLQGIRLKWISLSILRHLGNDFIRIAKLAHLSRTPGIQISFFIIMNLVLL